MWAETLAKERASYFSGPVCPPVKPYYIFLLVDYYVRPFVHGARWCLCVGIRKLSGSYTPENKYDDLLRERFRIVARRV